MASAAPPPTFSCLTQALAMLVVSSLLLFAFDGYGAMIFFGLQVLLMVLLLVSVPAIIDEFFYKWGKLAVAVGEAFLATLIVAVFAAWFVGIRSVINIWLPTLFLFLLFLLIGAHILTMIKEKVIERLSKSTDFQFSSGEIYRLKEIGKRQTLLYIALPLGFILAIGYGWPLGLSNVEILRLGVQLILVVASLILAIMLMVSAVIMSKSLILFDPSATKPGISDKSENWIWGNLLKFFKSPPLSESIEERSHSRSLDMAYLVADLRNIYFYDSVHNLILLLGFVIAILSTMNLQLVLNNVAWIILACLVLLFLFCYLPYSIGQYHLHETIVEGVDLEGIQRKELKEKLSEVSPLYPASGFISALVATGTAGSLLATLAYEALKGAIK